VVSVSFDSLLESKPIKLDLNGTPVCVTRIGDEVFAIADTCSHSEASLSEGDVTGFKIECWLHGAELICAPAKSQRHQHQFQLKLLK